MADAEAAGPKWYVQDDGAGNNYYYNSVTGEAQWEKPADFDGDEDGDGIPDNLQAKMQAAFEALSVGRCVCWFRVSSASASVRR